MGLSENSVPLLNGYNWGYTPFSDIPISTHMSYLMTWTAGYPLYRLAMFTSSLIILVDQLCIDYYWWCKRIVDRQGKKLDNVDIPTGVPFTSYNTLRPYHGLMNHAHFCCFKCPSAQHVAVKVSVLIIKNTHIYWRHTHITHIYIYHYDI